MRMFHHEMRDANELFIFGPPVEMFLSICAPIASTKAEVEAYANENSPEGAPYEAVNKKAFGSKHGIDMGGETPNPCNWEPKARRHWFLVSAQFV